MTEKRILDIGPFYHGTKANLNIGDFIECKFKSNYGSQEKANFVYMSATMDAAIWGAELALGENKQRIYIVAPTGEFEDDPNLTDKKFKGNPTRSYRSEYPLEIIGEVEEWEPHSKEILDAMLENLKKIKEQGIEAINE